MVSGRIARLPAESSNHLLNCLNGSELTLDSSRLLVVRIGFRSLAVSWVPRSATRSSRRGLLFVFPDEWVPMAILLLELRKKRVRRKPLACSEIRLFCFLPSP